MLDLGVTLWAGECGARGAQEGPVQLVWPHQRCGGGCGPARPPSPGSVSLSRYRGLSRWAPAAEGGTRSGLRPGMTGATAWGHWPSLFVAENAPSEPASGPPPPPGQAEAGHLGTRRPTGPLSRGRPGEASQAALKACSFTPCFQGHLIVHTGGVLSRPHHRPGLPERGQGGCSSRLPADGGPGRSRETVASPLPSSTPCRPQ